MRVDGRIGEGLVKIGAMSDKHVTEIVTRQAQGDRRLFGEIAINLGYVNIDAIVDYVCSKNQKQEV